MKTKQTLLAAGVSGLALLLAGCLTISVYPFYSDKDVVYEPGLIGNWTNLADSKQLWTFQKKSTDAYHVTYMDGNKSYPVDAHLFRLKDQLFLDLFNPNVPGEVMPPLVPTHFLLRVFQVKPTLRMAALNYEWLGNLLEKNPDAVRHHLFVTDENAKNTQIVLTADTSELQKFVLNNLKTDAAWKDPFDLQRN